MIELNLLPNIKRDLLRAQRIQRIIIVVSTLSSLVAIFLVSALFTTSQIQKNILMT
jgi:hypothetical protein